VVEIWGRAGAPGAAPWELRAPVALAGDAAGNVYVVDHPARDEGSGSEPELAPAAPEPTNGGAAQPAPEPRVLKFDRLGRPVPAFWQAARQSAALEFPVGIALTVLGGQAYLFMLDLRASPVVVVLDTDGHYVGLFGAGVLQRPLAIAAQDGTIYVGDNGWRRVLVFKPEPGTGAEETPVFAFAGVAAGYNGPVAALAPGLAGALWLHPGAGAASGGQPLRLASAAAYARSGVLWGGPFGTDRRSVHWHRLKALLTGLEEGAHAQFFVYTTENPAVPPPAPDLNAAGPFAAPAWEPLPLDATDGLVPSFTTSRARTDEALRQGNSSKLPPPTYLWVGAHLLGEGSSSPVLAQIWINYDHATYRQYLPAIFSREADQADLHDRLLGLFESFYDEAEEGIRGLNRLFDPRGAPAVWLPWLASWLGLDLDETWTEDYVRGIIQAALAGYGRRGTVAGLRQAIRTFAGVDAHLEEPLRGADWWALAAPDADPAVPHTAALGFTTYLAPNQGEGAILGGSAVLDAANLIGAADSGVPLFENVAHRFTVQVYRGQIQDEADLQRVRAVIEREKPAHTSYHLCVIEPRMRVGFQARLGIDTVVAGPLPPTPLNATIGNLVLGGDPPGQLGIGTQLGQTSRLALG
jgi:phage tail-like protein